jgi:hypothetical protein
MNAMTWPVVCSSNQAMVARLKAHGYIANVPFLLRAVGKLDFEILREALQLVVDRHEILRSPFAVQGGVLVQHAPEPYRLRLCFQDLSAVPDPIGGAKKDIAAGCRRSFELDTPGRLSVDVYRLAPDDHLIAIIIDHLAADGMSLGILGAEWRGLYQSLEARAPFAVPLEVPQYRAFMEWQRAWLAGADAEAQRGWWASQLSGMKERPPNTDGAGFRPAKTIELSREGGRRLSRLCVRHRLTPFMAMLAAYALLLAALTGDDDLLIATVRANRRHETARGTIGHFANLIPLRLMLDRTVTGEAFLRAVGEACRASYARDALPFLDVAEVASGRLGIPAAALAQYAINFMSFPEGPVAWSADMRVAQMWGLVDPAPLATGRLSLFVCQQTTRIGGTLIFDPAAVDDGWARSFASRLETILANLALSPHLSLQELLSVALGA